VLAATREESSPLSSVVVMLIIKTVSQKSDLLFDQNKDGHWFKKDFTGKFIRNDESVNEFFDTNATICYTGKDYRLSSWAYKQVGNVLSQAKLDFPDLSIEEIRQDLWKLVKLIKDEQITRQRRGVTQFEFGVELPVNKNMIGIFNHLMYLSNSLKQGKNVTLWYVNNYDIPKVQLIERFLNWYSQQ
jgi:hypothetical protein